MERRGEQRRGGKTQLCQWAECAIKTGVTTKVRADLTVNTAIEWSPVRGSFGEREIL